MKAIVVCILFLLIVSCGNPTAPQFAFQEPFRLPINESRLVRPDFTVTFEKLVSDGRCPDNPAIRCVWEGFAEIQLHVKQGGSDNSLNLTIPGFVTLADSARHVFTDTLGYRFTLLQLDPYPVNPDNRESEDSYSALLSITKSELEDN